MSEREKILRYYRASGEGELAARLLDTAEHAQRNRKYKVSEFLDPHGYSIAETIGAHYSSLKLVSNGGYHGAERVKVIFLNEEFRGTPDAKIEALAVTWDERYYELTHRDVLGALMGLGIKREIIGDIIMRGHGCQIIVDSSLSGFIIQDFKMIGAAPVTVSSLGLSDIAPREEKTKEIRTTVSALRLDVVAAAGFGTSRTTMSDEIGIGKLKVNWQDAKNSAKAIKVGDIISMRGRGRVEVCEVLGQTKKGRTSILLKRFM
ncbi:RNA-binding protein [Pelosinus sp. sgz500959]|uniref:YlmH family RNA-binding protein n=1 Tax=Pelosinus sp. sgz500959 TaxID=3242472 RepID=UPI003672AB93